MEQFQTKLLGEFYEIEAEPEGYWIYDPKFTDSYKFKCSNCNMHTRSRTRRCMWCGIKMNLNKF